MKMNESKYRILVVKDRSKHARTALQNAVNLAKKIGGSIDILYVKPPSEVVENDNQLAAWRELNEESTRAKRTLLEEVNHISTNEQIPISCNFAFGNLISEVQSRIDSTQPDMVVLGKRKDWVKELLGMDLTTYLLKNYQGALLIAREEQTLDTSDDLTLGLLDDFLVKSKSPLLTDLEKTTAKPITLLKIKSEDQQALDAAQPISTSGMKTFEFESGANVSSSVAKYIERSGVNLLCVSKNNLNSLNKTIKTVTRQIQMTNTPVLVL